MRVLYIVATLPFILFAILYLSGAFHREARQNEQPSPSSSPSRAPLPSPAAQTSGEPASTADTRIDTAPQHPPGLNAADFYKQAYGLYKLLAEEDQRALRRKPDELSVDQLTALREKVRPIVELLRNANAASYADWGIQIRPFQNSTPHLMSALNLAHVMNWTAVDEFSTQPAQAMADLQTVTQIGDSISRDASIGWLAGAATEVIARRSLLNHLADLDSQMLAQAQDWLGHLSDAESLSAASKAETIFAETFIQGLRDHHSLASLTALTPADQAMLDSYADRLPQALAELEWKHEIERQFAQKAQGSNADFQSWWKDVEQQAASRPLAQYTLSFLPTIQNRYLSGRVQNSMLQAGISILQSGEAVLAKYPDPSTGQPFQLVPTADGFELRSPYQFQGQPVVMPFPTAKP